MATVNLGLTTINGTDAKRNFPTVYNENLDKIDGMGVDYIVEQGTSGIWTYRKWNSGIAECWGTVTEPNLAMTTQQGSAWYGNQTTVSLPTLFNSTPIANINARTNSGGYLVNFAILILNTTTIQGYCEAINGAQTKTVYLDIHCIGTWK